MYLAPLLMIAAAFWGQTPACGQPTIERAQFQAPVVGLADVLACSITVDPRRLSFSGSACMVILHEYRHLLGYYDPTGFRWPNGMIDHSHSPDPTDIMYPVLSFPRRPCVW